MPARHLRSLRPCRQKSGARSISGMPVAAVFEFGKEAIGAYDRSLERHADVLLHQPGRRSHVCIETDDGYMVVDIWDSLEAFEEFGKVLGDLAAEFPYRADVKLLRVHNIV
jgi:hypothetical protein